MANINGTWRTGINTSSWNASSNASSNGSGNNSNTEVNYNPYSNDGIQNLYKKYNLSYGGNDEANKGLRQIVPEYTDLANQGAQFQLSLEPQRQSAVSQLLNSMGAAGQQAQMTQLQNQAGEQAANAARQTALMNRSMGMGDGFTAGNTAALMGQGAMQQNQIAQNFASPQYQAQVLQSILQAISGAGNNGGYQMLNDLSNHFETVQNNKVNQAAQSGSPLGALLGAAGGIAGQYVSKQIGINPSKSVGN